MSDLPISLPLFPLVVAFLLAFVLAHAGTPVAIRAARATGFLDKPTGVLKSHREPTPYLGGLAVFVPFITAAALVFDLDQRFLGILLAATLAALLGLMDDFGAMRWSVKLVGQAIVVLVLLRADVRMDLDALPLWLNVLLTAAWMLAMMNAVNFLDIMDGLAASVTCVSAAFFLAVAVLTGTGAMASLSAALLGALVGYLRFSLPQARIFLGDCGSLFLGATLGALALGLDYSATNRWAVIAPALVLGVPVFEFTFTVLVRMARRRAPWRGSPDHVALRLRRMGLSVRNVLILATIAGLGFGASALRLLVSDERTAWFVGGGTLLSACGAAVLLLRAPEPTPPPAPGDAGGPG